MNNKKLKKKIKLKIHPEAIVISIKDNLSYKGLLKKVTADPEIIVIQSSQ